MPKDVLMITTMITTTTMSIPAITTTTTTAIMTTIMTTIMTMITSTRTSTSTTMITTITITTTITIMIYPTRIMTVWMMMVRSVERVDIETDPRSTEDRHSYLQRWCLQDQKGTMRSKTQIIKRNGK